MRSDREHASMEGEAATSEHRYFTVRPQIDNAVSRFTFRKGFSRAWSLQEVTIRDLDAQIERHEVTIRGMDAQIERVQRAPQGHAVSERSPMEALGIAGSFDEE